MKRLLLAGGGQAHVFVLRALARSRQGFEVVLVTPSDELIYTGMLPGWIAGHYSLRELTIPLAPLREAAGVRLVRARVQTIDLERRIVHTDLGEAICFDLLSIATGPAANFESVQGAREHALPLRPLDRFIAEWQQIDAHARSAAPRLAVIGAGAGGVELSLAAKHRHPDAQVQLVTGEAPIMPGHGARARALVQGALRRAGVQIVAAAAERIELDGVVLDSGVRLTADRTLLMTGAAPAPWLRDSGLAVDADGFIAVNQYLQSTSHAFVFAAGDAATTICARRPRSGVYAVRAGPPLAANLLAAMRGKPPLNYRPQQHALYLLSTGPRHAIASWGPLAFDGGWVWRWKNAIDRAYIAKFKSLS